MESARDSETLMQSTVARALHDLQLVGKPDAEALVLRDLSASPCMEPIVANIRALPPPAVNELFAAAQARLEALASLARCDAALDALERESVATPRYAQIEEAAMRLSLLLRGASSTADYAEAVAAAQQVVG
ncbi:MAG: hypothetical protein DI536_19525 [Archangium gephyra]|uniref:Uncharacterized protein n=1 Tax=Archangium gephyra TaxID=48 RepID=A0A2W5T4U4_9BACT|nr:MAG: hypothetical protein DI536_19525 [Archangium gephyra]